MSGCTAKDASMFHASLCRSPAFKNSRSFFVACVNLIILTDTDHFYYRGIPSITLHDILQCIHHLPNDIDIPPHQQLHTLHHTLQQRFPLIAQRAQQSLLNLLHLLVYFPGGDDDIYLLLLTLLTKCPQAMTAVDSSGRTPLHHVMTSTRHIMDDNSYELLLDHCPDTVVHLAIRLVAQSVVVQSPSSWRTTPLRLWQTNTEF